jgi:hypothetical protein
LPNSCRAFVNSSSALLVAFAKCEDAKTKKKWTTILNEQRASTMLLTPPEILLKVALGHHASLVLSSQTNRIHS